MAAFVALFACLSIFASHSHDSPKRVLAQILLPTSAGLTYDANGNLTSDGARNYDYDDENQLIWIRGTNSATEFVYDGLGRKRISREYKSVAATESVALSSTIRSDFAGWVGYRISVGATALKVTHLGRWVLSGDSGTHAGIPGSIGAGIYGGRKLGELIFGGSGIE